MAPGELSSILNGLVNRDDAALLVDYRSSDDAAVYQIDDRRCLLSTTDFFPPMVADARTFGRIAAANALSDIFAMGGKPLYALNIVCFPQNLDKSILFDILSGGAEKCAEAEATLAGGHSIYDKEIKYGLAVTGIADKDRIYRNNTPRVGDKLILTKPLGVGFITAAERTGDAEATDISTVIASMERLNKYAAEKLSGFDISACTDITGFGLAVHALEMASGNVTIELNSEAIPFFENVKYYIDEGYVTGGGVRNRLFAGIRTDTGKIAAWMQELVFDPQTSGGLLIAVSSEQADDLARAIHRDDPLAEVVGNVKKLENSEVIFI